jgi:hypothetical protein
MLGTIYHRMHYDSLHVRIHNCIATRWDRLFIGMTVWAPPTEMYVSLVLNLLSYTSTIINYIINYLSILVLVLEDVCIFLCQCIHVH